MKASIEDLCRRTFKDITAQEGDIINHLGMSFSFQSGSVSISQQKYTSDLLDTFGNPPAVPYPAIGSLFDVSEDGVSCDRNVYRSLNASLLYAAKRTYPELLIFSCFLASRFPKATELDMKHCKRSLAYLAFDPNHSLTISPGSLDLVASADASYAVHGDGKSHTGGCVGFRGCGDLPDSYFIFISGKQPIVTKSSMEAELVAANTVVDYLVWARAMCLEMHSDLLPSILYQDNKSTITAILKGAGTFKRS